MSSNPIGKEALTYLDCVPSLVGSVRDPAACDAVGQIALNLGNYLIWIRGMIEDGPPEVDPMGQHPRSVFSLGKQLRAAGLAALDRAKDARAGADRVVDPYVANLNLHVRRLEDRVARLEGGAK